MIRLWIAAVCAVLVVGPVEAATCYVRDGGTATGTQGISTNGGSWSQAYDQLTTAATNCSRGDTIYVASGTYTGGTFNTAESGTTLITIKGATVADHGTATGWVSSYSVDANDGGSQAIFTSGLTFNTSYWIFDGVVGPVASRVGTAYGFKINPVNYAVQVYNLSVTITNITISHIYAVAPSGDVEKFFLSTDNSTKSVNAVTVSHCFGDGWSNFTWATSAGLSMADWTHEYNIILNGYSSAANHGEDLNNNYGDMVRWTIRYNWFEGRSSGTGTIVTALNGASTGPIWIYGNVLKSQVAGDGGIVCVHENSDVRIYNNTFISMTSGGAGAWLSGTSSDCVMSGEWKNNLLYSMDASVGSANSGMTHTHNAFFTTTNTPSSGNEATRYVGAAGDPFTDLTNKDVSLTSAVASAMDAGTTLASPYNQDMFGNTRGADGKWDRGAIEFGTGGGGSVGGTNPSGSPRMTPMIQLRRGN